MDSTFVPLPQNAAVYCKQVERAANYTLASLHAATASAAVATVTVATWFVLRDVSAQVVVSGCAAVALAFLSGVLYVGVCTAVIRQDELLTAGDSHLASPRSELADPEITRHVLENALRRAILHGYGEYAVSLYVQIWESTENAAQKAELLELAEY